VIEVDVREDEVPQILEAETVLCERSLERPETRRRTAVHERRLVTGKQVRGNDPRPREVQQVEELEAAT